MVQCPFCHYNNEDGALFCEQCKSDLAGVAVTLEAAAVDSMVQLADKDAAWLHTAAVLLALQGLCPASARQWRATPDAVARDYATITDTRPSTIRCQCQCRSASLKWLCSTATEPNRRRNRSTVCGVPRHARRLRPWSMR